MTSLAKKYGEVYSIRLGQEYVVVLCSFELLKEALVKKAEYFSGRPSPGLITKVNKRTGKWARLEISGHTIRKQE